MEARKWLRTNGYDDVADLIDEIVKEWRASGNGTRRNWWDVLAGRWNGQPCVTAGRKFPILRAAQIRQGRPITPNAICRNENENVPPLVKPSRWRLKYGTDQGQQLSLDFSQHSH